MQDVVDIEETVWAPRYGIKGSIDASLRVGLEPQHHKPPLQPQQARPAGVVGAEQALAPFEFKTGRPHMSHNAQVRRRPWQTAACMFSACAGKRATGTV